MIYGLVHAGDAGWFTTGYLVCAIVAAAAAVIGSVLVPAGKPAAVVGHGH